MNNSERGSVLSDEDDIYLCGECRKFGVWPANDALICPECNRYITPFRKERKVVQPVTKKTLINCGIECAGCDAVHSLISCDSWWGDLTYTCETCDVELKVNKKKKTK